MAFTTGKNKQGSYREYSLENKGIEIPVPLLFTAGNSFPGKYSHRENSPGNRSRERSTILLLQALVKSDIRMYFPIRLNQNMYFPIRSEFVFSHPVRVGILIFPSG
jgi:hypothetical protein